MVNVYKLSQSKKKPLDFVVSESGCFEVINRKPNPDGYTLVSDGKKQIRTHRFIYQEMFGEIPKGLVVRHKCDNRICINPEHLELGTQVDNIRDMYERGRQKHLKGSSKTNAKLTEQDVKMIKKLKNEYGSRALAKKFGVSRNTIRLILKGETWNHVS